MIHNIVKARFVTAHSLKAKAHSVKAKLACFRPNAVPQRRSPLTCVWVPAEDRRIGLAALWIDTAAERAADGTGDASGVGKSALAEIPLCA